MMKTPYPNIYKVLRTNRFVVLSVVITSTLVCLFSIGMVVRVYHQVQDRAFVVSSEGEVIPLKLVHQQENLEIEALAHLQLFHEYFYDLSPYNHERHLEKALWMGDASVSELYLQKRAEGLYNRLLQYSLLQKVTQIDSRVNVQRSPFRFETTIQLEIKRGELTDYYELKTSGALVRVDRHFPHNPHGLLITDYFENRLYKIEP